jgi:hypothetical protein
VIGQILKSQTPQLLVEQSLGGIAMEVEISKISEHLRDALARVFNGTFV